MMYKLIIFDTDGTLINTDKVTLQAYRKAVKAHGLEVPDEKTMRVFPHVSKYIFTKAYYGLSPTDSYRIVDAYQAAYEELYVECAELYEGALDTLMVLNEKRIRLLLLTDREEGEMQAVLKRFGVDSMIETVRMNDKARLAEQLELVIRMYGFWKEESLYIGDKVEDMDVAQRADIDFLPVTYGYGFEASPEDIGLPVVMLNKISNLPIVLSKMQVGTGAHPDVSSIELRAEVLHSVGGRTVY